MHSVCTYMCVYAKVSENLLPDLPCGKRAGASKAVTQHGWERTDMTLKERHLL